MILLDGQALSAQILASLSPRGSLHIILVGNDPTSLKYVTLKQRACDQIGQSCVIHHLSELIPTPDLITLINRLNRDPAVTGFFIQLPLPKHLDREKILNLIIPTKDVDGLCNNSPFTPAVVRGVITLLDHYHLSVAEKTAVIINDSKLVGIPLKNILEKRHAEVIICNEFTKNISEISRGADFIFSATGQKGLITPDYIKPGAVVVDIGGGDVNFAQVSEHCSYITPTVGGVGPMTIACLLKNLTDKI